MPLVDPITMSSTIAKGAAAQAQAAPSKAGPASSSPATTYSLRPVQIRQTLLAQAARHALPALLASLFAVRFRALVADPVPTMTSTLPLTAALQVGYAVFCLPIPGSHAGGAKAPSRKQKPRPGESLKKRTSAGEGMGLNAVVVRLTLSPTPLSHLEGNDNC